MFLQDGKKHNEIQASAYVGKYHYQYKYNRRHVIGKDLPDSVNCYRPPLDGKNRYKQRHRFGRFNVSTPGLRLRTDYASNTPGFPSDMKPREQIQCSIYE